MTITLVRLNGDVVQEWSVPGEGSLYLKPCVRCEFLVEHLPSVGGSLVSTLPHWNKCIPAHGPRQGAKDVAGDAPILLLDDATVRAC
jgi:hypothetical protein